MIRRQRWNDTFTCCTNLSKAGRWCATAIVFIVLGQQKMQLIRYLQVDTAISIKSAGDFRAMEHHSQQALMCMLTHPCPMFKLCIGMVLIQLLNAEMA